MTRWLTPAHHERARKMRNKGATWPAIADALDISRTQLRRIQDQYHAAKRGEAPPRARLRPDQIDRIRAMLEAGYTHQAIAADIGCKVCRVEYQAAQMRKGARPMTQIAHVDQEPRERALAMFTAGATLPMVRAALGVSCRKAQAWRVEWVWAKRRDAAAIARMEEEMRGEGEPQHGGAGANDDAAPAPVSDVFVLSLMQRGIKREEAEWQAALYRRAKAGQRRAA